MAGKGWTAQAAVAAGAAAGTGAAQLGLGYGLGVVQWPAIATADDSMWLGSLGWATWIAASATVFGSVIASRMRRERPSGLWRLALALAGAIGALITVALIALPARYAVPTETFSPQIIAGAYAILGVLMGLVVAYWAVVSRPVAANLMTTAGWLWGLATAAVVIELSTHRDSATYLTSWQFADDGRARLGSISLPSGLLTLLAAMLVGMIAAWPAVRRRELGLGTASSGAVGPLLVAVAFLGLSPRLTGTLGPLESAYLVAPYAVLAGLAGSALMVALGRQAAAREARPRNQPPSTPPQQAPPAAAREVPPRKAQRGKKETRPQEGEPTARGAAAPAGTPADDRPVTGTGRSETAGTGTDDAADQAPTATAAPADGKKPSRLSFRRAGKADPSKASSGKAAPSKAAPSKQAPRQAPAAEADRPTPPAARPVPTGSARPAERDGVPTPAVPRPIQPPPVAPEPVAPPPVAPKPATAPGFASPEPASGSRSGEDPARPEPTPSRGTVAPPPASPPIARINPPRESEDASATASDSPSGGGRGSARNGSPASAGSRGAGSRSGATTGRGRRKTRREEGTRTDEAVGSEE
ncbi:Hansenula MRAKII killer toxin-resistant protein 1 [Mangrovihabitans endophyticus]|nr:Hansenula MRAKII killer toxin-resistant protein 1 [Mangrovihabitans endophyticus]